MREFASPTTYVVPATANLTDDIVRNAVEHPESIAFSRADGGGWSAVSAAEFLDQVRAVARGLVAAGVGPGDRVGLLSRTRYEWTLVDYATWYAGAVTVPLYPSSPREQVEEIIERSGARTVVVETAEQRLALPGTVQRSWAFDEGAVAQLAAIGAGVPEGVLEDRRASVGADSLATIVFTSGTTGRPKGCMLTHGNFLFELEVAAEELDELFAGPDAATLLFLPLPHVLARVVQVGAVRRRVRLGHSGDARTLSADLATFRPTFVLAVPRVLERLFNTASLQAAANGRGRRFDRAAATAIEVSRSSGSGGGRLVRLRGRLFERRVYAPMRDALGGRCRYAVSGGAPLGERLAHFYRGIGIAVLEGYGLTETTGAVTVNRPDSVKVGTVGRPLPGTAVRVAADGELHVRGGQVFSGYWEDETETSAVLTSDGWLRTGDVGEIDDEGFVHVTGRKNEILVTAGGKNVSPDALEDVLRAHPLVAECLVVGDGRPYVAAVVTLDPDATRRWAATMDTHEPARDLSRLARSARLRAEIQLGVDEANATVSQAESIRRFVVLADQWTEEGGQLTPSLKLRRNVVRHQVRAEIEALYAR